MIDISSLTNHLCFEDIFKNCQKEDGSYDWLKIAKTKNLPIAFIDKYFFQIYQYREIERKENLSIFIIKKYGNYLNWNILFLNQNIDEEIIINFSNKLDKANWKLCAMTQKLSFEFLKKFYKNIQLNDLQKNKNISQELIQDYKNYLDLVDNV